jgi:ribonuclease HII
MQKILDSRERKRLHKMSLHEQRLVRLGYQQIAGIDEAGRGPLAGPVVAAACILPCRYLLPQLNDSKQLSCEQREELFIQITSDARIIYGVGIASVERIDQINILQATFEAMQESVKNLASPPDYLLIDGNQLPAFDCPKEGIVRGDAASISIAAASIIAKVTRDRIMIAVSARWPQYGFAQHKGYGTPQHLEAFERWGPCPLHRKSFEPIKSWAGYSLIV